MTEDKKKLSLQELSKNLLAAKKNKGNQEGGFSQNDVAGKKMKSQLTKKPNNQRRRTGV